ncbi:MAG: DNA replication and repair protein RecF [Bacteroidales bacterium]|nr:DNA replication and repair protein RecF [Bacteroidales bacterium]
MFLQKLSLINFKNYKEAELSFSEKINCFIGDNGTGKTNLLDAIYYLSFCKSYFNPVDYQNILHNESFFAIHGKYLKNGNNSDTVSCIQKRNHHKQFKLNKKEYDRLADHIGLFPLIMISPYDRDLINDGSEIRRKYINSVISQFDKFYLNDLINYNKALFQRNTLLKHFAEKNYFDSSALEIWDKQMIKLGERIYTKRKEFLIEFAPLFQHYFEFISLKKETVSITYESQLNKRKFEQLLSIALEKDRNLRYSTVGIHKDDLILNIGGYPIKKFGSQGQQKSFVIAIKFAQFDYTRNIKGFKPVLLLDDIFDKLDILRVKQIIKLVSENNFGQVFITDTQKERIEKVFKTINIDHRIFEIKSGQAFELKNNELF